MMLRNRSGFTLTDMLVSAALVGIITVMATVGISAFINEFNELRAFSLLQEQAMQLIETVRYGELIRDPDTNTTGKAYMGFNGAYKIRLTNDLTSGIGVYGGARLSVPSRDSQTNSNNSDTGEYVRYYWNTANGKILCDVSSAIRVPGKTYPYSIFPRSSEHDIEVRKFEISRVDATDAGNNMSTGYGDSNTYFYRIDLEADIYISRESNNTRSVSFTTYVSRPVDASNF